MDANGTRFQLLLGLDDWSRSRQEDGRPVFDNFSTLAWDTAASELTLAPRVLEFTASPGNRKPSLADRRGAARDRFGSWYWISDDRREILVQSSGSGVFSHFWASTDQQDRAPARFGEFDDCIPETEPAALELSGLVVTDEHYLVCGILDFKGLAVFDLFRGGAPRQFAWPASALFVPFDMSPAVDGGLWILDRENAALWRLDRAFRVVSPPGFSPDHPAEELFQSCDGGTRRLADSGAFPAGEPIESSPLAAHDPVAIEALADGSVLVLDSDPSSRFSTIYRYRDGSPVGTPVSTEAARRLIEPQYAAGFSLLATDFAYVAEQTTASGKRFDILYVAAESGDQAFAFQLAATTGNLTLQPLAEYLPMRLWGGRSLNAGGGQVAYDSGARWVPLIEQRRPKYLQGGTLQTRALDGKEPGCVWHRILFEACLPPDTRLAVWTRAHDDPDAVQQVPWSAEPDPYRRHDGSELPWAWRVDNTVYETFETLPQRARGRYLQLKIALSGNGRSSPRVRAARVYYPRFSYPEHYLPAAYRRDAASASFLDRFMASIEGFYTAIEDKIASAETLFDPRTVPPDALEWLAGWFGVALDPAWDPARQRLFIRYATRFFEARGTLPGLTMALRLVLEACAGDDLFLTPVPVGGGVRIVERFRTRVTPGIVLGDASGGLGLPVLPQEARWTPSQGPADLDARYRAALGLSGDERYPLRDADVPTTSVAAWQEFSQAALGFVPAWSNTPEMQFSSAALWRDFLIRRYRTLAALNAAYRAAYQGFDAVAMPVELPAAPAAVLDWYQFQGAVLKVRSAAHRFTVFLPMTAGEAADPVAHDRKLQLARRVIDLEKPAHTVYEVKFYWAFFRIGEARLGHESVLDQGSRAPQLMRPVTLGASTVGSSYFDRGTPCSPNRRPWLREDCASPHPARCTSEENTK